MTLTCSIAASRATTALSRRADSTSGSPPVRITSQISRMRADIAERGIERLRREPLARRADHLAAEAEPAIDRADVDELEQHAIGIAVHDALDRAVRVVADRIGAFPLPALKLARIRHELARDRIVRIGAIDQIGMAGVMATAYRAATCCSAPSRSRPTSPASARSSGCARSSLRHPSAAPQSSFNRYADGARHLAPASRFRS